MEMGFFNIILGIYYRVMTSESRELRERNVAEKLQDRGENKSAVQRKHEKQITNAANV